MVRPQTVVHQHREQEYEWQKGSEKPQRLGELPCSTVDMVFFLLQSQSLLASCLPTRGLEFPNLAGTSHLLLQAPGHAAASTSSFEGGSPPMGETELSP